MPIGAYGSAATAGRSSSAAAPADQAARGSLLFHPLSVLYQQSSRFVHGSTPAYRSLYESIRAIGLDPAKTEALADLLKGLCETGMLLLSLYHLWP